MSVCLPICCESFVHKNYVNKPVSKFLFFYLPLKYGNRCTKSNPEIPITERKETSLLSTRLKQQTCNFDINGQSYLSLLYQQCTDMKSSRSTYTNERCVPHQMLALCQQNVS